MDLSLIQKDILVTLITLYHRHSQPVKGEDIAEVIHRNPGTIRNQMQALKTLELVDGVPGPKGGYNPTMKAYQELNISQSGQDVQVPIARNGVLLPELSATEVDLTTLCHPDVCHAVVRIMGSVRQFQNGDEITVGPTPVNKLLIRGEIFGKDERNGALMISISEMISLPKKPVRAYMSHPLHVVPATATLEDAVRLFAEEQINGAPVMDGTTMQGIVTVTDVVVTSLEDGATVLLSDPPLSLFPQPTARASTAAPPASVSAALDVGLPKGMRSHFLCRDARSRTRKAAAQTLGRGRQAAIILMSSPLRYISAALGGRGAVPGAGGATE